MLFMYEAVNYYIRLEIFFFFNELIRKRIQMQGVFVQLRILKTVRSGSYSEKKIQLTHRKTFIHSHSSATLHEHPDK